MPASLRVALIPAIPLRVVLFSIHCFGGGGSFRGFHLMFPTMTALTNRPSVWVTSPATCQSQVYIWWPGKWVPGEFTDPVDPDFGQDSIYHLAFVCPPSLSHRAHDEVSGFGVSMSTWSLSSTVLEMSEYFPFPWWTVTQVHGLDRSSNNSAPVTTTFSDLLLLQIQKIILFESKLNWYVTRFFFFFMLSLKKQYLQMIKKQ